MRFSKIADKIQPAALVTTLCVLLLQVITGQANASEIPALDEVLPLLTEADHAALINDGELLLFHEDGVSPNLLPETSLTGEVARQIVLGDLNIGIEGLFFTSTKELPAGFAAGDMNERQLILYNIMRSVSTLEGLEYYSASRGEMRLLFEESWMIDGEDGKEPLPDPLVSVIPEEDFFYVHQKDKSFANNTQKMSFRASGGVIAANIVNQTPMRYKGFIRVADPGNVQMHLIAVPVEEGILVYGTMSAHTRDVKAFLDRARNSFTNRVIALAGWYKERLSEEFRTSAGN